MIKCIFFDIGSTLVDESVAYDIRAREMLAGTDISFRAFDEKRREFAELGLDGNAEAIKYFELKKTPWHTEAELLFDDVADTLSYLTQKGYKLGIIANQVEGLRKRLEGWGILEYFSVIISSSECGIAKPDRAVFEMAIKQAGCAPDECIMVGDRLDNDIAPAKALGMITAWVTHATVIFELADHKIADISELKTLL